MRADYSQDIRLVLSRALHDTALCHNEGRGLWSLLEFELCFMGRSTCPKREDYYIYRGSMTSQQDLAVIINVQLKNVAHAVGNFKTDYYVERSIKENVVESFGNHLLTKLFDKAVSTAGEKAL